MESKSPYRKALRLFHSSGSAGSDVWPILVSFPLGIATGLMFPAAASALGTLPAVFVQLLQIVVGPLVLLTICLGIFQSGHTGAVRRTVVIGILGAFGLTAVALAVGIALAAIFQAGVGLHLTPATSASAPLVDFKWIQLVPGNAIAALSRGDTTQLLAIGALLGVAMLRSGNAGERLAGVLATLLEVLFQLTAVLVKTAPLAAFGAAAALVAGKGMAVFLQFLPLVGALMTGLAGLALIVFPLMLRARGVRVFRLWRQVQQAVLIAFSSASGAAALPVAIASLERSGMQLETVRVVYPLCAMLNATGSTLFIGCAAAFMLQANGMVISPALGFELFAALYVLGKVIPSVPRGAIAIIATGVASFGLSAQSVGAGVGLILAIDTVFDMSRTAVNVWGSCALVAAVNGRR